MTDQSVCSNSIDNKIFGVCGSSCKFVTYFADFRLEPKTNVKGNSVSHCPKHYSIEKTSSLGLFFIGFSILESVQ